MNTIPEEVKEKIEKESNKRWPRVAGYGNWINRDDAVELAEWALQEFSGMKGWHVGMKVIEEGGNKGTIHGIMAIEGQTRLLVDCSSNQWYWTSEKNIKPLEGDTVSKEEGKVYEIEEVYEKFKKSLPKYWHTKLSVFVAYMDEHNYKLIKITDHNKI